MNYLPEILRVPFYQIARRKSFSLTFFFSGDFVAVMLTHTHIHTHSDIKLRDFVVIFSYILVIFRIFKRVHKEILI